MQRVQLAAGMAGAGGDRTTRSRFCSGGFGKDVGGSGGAPGETIEVRTFFFFFVV